MAATSDTLTAAWLAEHVMGWHLVEHIRDPHEGDVILWHWVDKDGVHQAHGIGWNPLTNDADATQVLLHIAGEEDDIMLNLVGKTWGVHLGQQSLKRPRWVGEAWSKVLRLAICRAAEAYVMKQL